VPPFTQGTASGSAERTANAPLIRDRNVLNIVDCGEEFENRRFVSFSGLSKTALPNGLMYSTDNFYPRGWQPMQAAIHAITCIADMN
jgi:hypothetical protein